MHLNDEQWAAVTLNEGDEAAAEHLAKCPACQLEVESIVASLCMARAQSRRALEQPEDFWRHQRESIRARLGSRRLTPPWKRWVWVTATITLIVLASALVSRNNMPPTGLARTDPDDALLLSVQRSIQTDVPQALRPAALLTVEMSRAQAVRTNR